MAHPLAFNAHTSESSRLPKDIITSQRNIENIGSRIDMQTHAGNGTAARVTSNRATVTVFVTVLLYRTTWPTSHEIHEPIRPDNNIPYAVWLRLCTRRHIDSDAEMRIKDKTTGCWRQRTVQHPVCSLLTNTSTVNVQQQTFSFPLGVADL